MNRHYAVYYRNTLVKRTLTRAGAYSVIGRLVIEKGWDAAELEIKEGCAL